jgi:dTDP-glucose 4,6-dehydratase
VFNLLESIRLYNKKSVKKIKLIHISTDEVYGDILNKSKRANEDYPYKPSSPYAASKASADHLIKSYIRTYKFPAIISNCSNNYGPNQFPEKLIPKIIFNVINNKPIPIYAKGLNTREWIYVEDHCRALEILAKKGKLGESYNIGSNINLSNIELRK